jgi:hypothetical protein
MQEVCELMFPIPVFSLLRVPLATASIRVQTYLKCRFFATSTPSPPVVPFSSSRRLRLVPDNILLDRQCATKPVLKCQQFYKHNYEHRW